VVRCGAYAFRDELLFRGVPLALARDKVPRPWPVLFCALLGAAPLALVSPWHVEALVLAVTSGLVFALIWSDGAGGLVAWASHTGWLMAIQIGLQGSALDVEWKAGNLASGADAAGVPAYLAAATFLVVAIRLGTRKRFALQP
jgi:hypothetical protein